MAPRFKSFLKTSLIASAVAFVFAVGCFAAKGAMSGPELAYLAFAAVVVGLFIGWKVDEYRRARMQAAVLDRIMQGQPPAVFVDKDGSLVPDDKAPAAVRELREGYEEFLKEKVAAESPENEK